MSGATTQRCHRSDLPHAGRGAQLVLLSQAAATVSATAPPTTDRGDSRTPASVSTQLRLPAHSRLAAPSGHPVQSQDSLSPSQTQGLAGLASAAHPASWPAARGQSRRAPIQPALGLRHHHPQPLESTETPAGRHHRLRRPHDLGLEITNPSDRRGCLRTAPGSALWAFCPATTVRQGTGVPHRQWTRIYLSPIPAAFDSNGTGRLSHTLPQPPIQRLGRILLRQFQARLSRTSSFGNSGRGTEPYPRLDYPLQRNRPSQRSGHVVSNHFLSTTVDRITPKNYKPTCPVLTGSHHFLNSTLCRWRSRRGSSFSCCGACSTWLALHDGQPLAEFLVSLPSTPVKSFTRARKIIAAMTNGL